MPSVSQEATMVVSAPRLVPVRPPRPAAEAETAAKAATAATMARLLRLDMRWGPVLIGDARPGVGSPVTPRRSGDQLRPTLLRFTWVGGDISSTPHTSPFLYL